MPDIIIIGAGPGGYETAARAASAGKKVILIERGHLGGTCLNRGCIPTKALCRSAEVADTVASAAEYGIGAQMPAVDYAAVAARKDAVVASLREGVAQVLKDVEVVTGEARFVSPSEVSVGDKVYSAPTIIVATGSKPARLDIPGAEYALTSDEFLALTSLPPSVTVIGGGVIGLEFASVLKSFGVDVTVVEGMPEILPPFDAEIAKRLRMALKRRKINIVTDAVVKEIGRDGMVSCVVKGKEKSIGPAMVLMSVGRRPVIPDGLVEAGAPLTERGFLKVDSDMLLMQSGGTSVYAIGDVNGLCMLAHAATAQGEIVLGLRKDLGPVPSAVFTRPECAMAGLTEAQCAALGKEVRIGRATFQANGKARAMGEPDGMVKTIVSAEDGTLLGCHILGPHASDLIAEAALVMTSGLPASAIHASIHTHPTLSEVLPASLP
ncbi:MAG: dihydrolipoyl dehydrogenase [Duncaniella sp.]|nr:dihydrolipoyl dehydrogenase [Duncaniella sp.]MDE6178738.1 dihydrolipoyl dehydrogenase [Duncaniella sp.]